MNTGKSIIGLLSFGSNRGSRVAGAKVYIESLNDSEKIAFQKTGESGKVTVAHLDKGIYKLVIELPPQTGKLEAKGLLPDDIQVGYHNEKKLLLFQIKSGYFSIRFSKISNLTNNNITLMFEPDDTFRVNRITFGKLEVTNKYGAVTLEVSAHSAKRFARLTSKYKEDVAMTVIRKSPADYT